MGGGRVEGQTAFPGSRDGGSEKREEGKGRIMPDKLLIVGFKLFSPLPRIPRWPRKLHPVTITILIFKGSVIRYPTWTLPSIRRFNPLNIRTYVRFFIR